MRMDIVGHPMVRRRVKHLPQKRKPLRHHHVRRVTPEDAKIVRQQLLDKMNKIIITRLRPGFLFMLHEKQQRGNAMKISTIRTVLMITCLSILTGCASTYYGTLEKVGIHKRDIMVDRVEDARDAQEDAKEEFQTALEQFTAVVEFKGGDLEKKYNKLNDTYEACEKKADAVHKRIGKVEDVSDALFKEWEGELELYSSPRLREDSRKKLDRTRRDYNRLIKAMKRAEKKIQPVLVAFRDQVLYLKHNLNAQAISSLKNELVNIEDDVAGLVSEMEASIKEAEVFIEALRKEG